MCRKSFPKKKTESAALVAALAVSAVLAAPSAQAAGAAGIVFDPTNYVENTLTATNAIRQVQNQVQNYLMQKYGIDMNLQGLPMDQINQILISKMPAMKGDYVLNYGLLLQQLEQQMGVAAQDVQQQYQAMTASGLTPEQYMDQELQMAQSDQAYAAAGFQQAENAIQQVNAQAEVVQRQSDLVGHTVGATQSMHLMQSQLATLTSQNQQLLQLVAARQKMLAEKDSQEAAEKANGIQAEKQFTKIYTDPRDDQQKAEDFSRELNKAMNPDGSPQPPR